MKSRIVTFCHLVLVLSVNLATNSMATDQSQENREQNIKGFQKDVNDVLADIIKEKDKKDAVTQGLQQLDSMRSLKDFEDTFIEVFNKKKEKNQSTSFAPEWCFTCLCIKYGFWELAYLACDRVLNKDLAYGRYYDIDAQYMLTILNDKNNKLAKKTLWLLYEQDYALGQALFDASLKAYNWRIASKLCNIDYRLHIMDNLDPDKVYSFLKEKDERWSSLQDKFFQEIGNQDKINLLDRLNTHREIDLFKRILSTGGNNFGWHDINAELRKEMIEELFDSLGYYQKLQISNVNCSWFTYEVIKDLAGLSKRYQIKCAVAIVVVLLVICIPIVGNKLLYNEIPLEEERESEYNF